MSAALQKLELPPEALALIKEGTPKPQVESPMLSPTVSPAKEELRQAPEISPNESDPAQRSSTVAASPVAPPPAEAEAPKTTKSRPREREQEPEMQQSLAALSVRVPAEIPSALVRASADRKVRRLKPFTQQEIVTEALRQWLKKHDYLP